MKVLSNPQIVTCSAKFPTTRFGIKKSGLHHIFHILRNQLYSNKLAAFIREYSTNAVDAHAVVGKELVPIQVSLPTQVNPTFIVRDFGPGLSEADVRKIFCLYGESTKRKSNKFVGHLGLGSKSAFAYVDQFTITSYFNGLKTTYSAYIDKSKLGQVAKLRQEPTQEPSGLEIEIPVLLEDHESVKTYALDIFKHFKVTPELKGAKQPARLADQEKVFEGAGWYIAKSYQDGPFAVMGGVAYPIKIDLLGQHVSKIPDQDNLIIEFALGSLVTQASREALDYNPATIKALINRLAVIRAELNKQASHMLNNAKTYYEAHALWADHAHVLHAMGANATTWKGHTITSSHIQLPPGVRLVRYQLSRKGHTYTVSETDFDKIQSKLNSTLPFYVPEGLKHLRARVRRFLYVRYGIDENAPAKDFNRTWDDGCYVLQPVKTGKSGGNALKDFLSLLGEKFPSIGKIEPLLHKEEAKPKAVPHFKLGIKSGEYCYQLHYHNCDLSKSSGYYLVVSQEEINALRSSVGSRRRDGRTEWEIAIKSLRLPRSKQLILIKRKHLEFLNLDNWKPVEPLFTRVITKAIPTSEAWHLHAETLGYCFNSYKQKAPGLPKSSYFSKVLIQAQKTTTIRALPPLLLKRCTELPADRKNHPALTKFFQRYPMLKLVGWGGGRSKVIEAYVQEREQLLAKTPSCYRKAS